MANAEGSIYRVENGVAIPYASLGGSGGSGSVAKTLDIKNHCVLSSALLAKDSGAVIVDANAYIYGGVTELKINLRFTKTFSISASSTMPFVSYTKQDTDDDKYLHAKVSTACVSSWGEELISASYTSDITGSTAGGLFSVSTKNAITTPDIYLNLQVVFINSETGSGSGGGGGVDYEGNVDISSLITSQSKLAVTEAKMWRWGRITSLFIEETFTEAWSTPVSAARCNIVDTTGKCLPNYNEMFHIGEAWAWQQGQAADYFGFVRGSVTPAHSSFAFFEMDFNGNSSISFALGDYIRFNMTFINRYEG